MLLSAIFSAATIARVKQQFGANSAATFSLENEPIPDSTGYWCLLCKTGLVRLFPRAAVQEQITVLDIGSGTNFLPMYYTIKEVFPTAKVKYVCVDPDPAGAKMLRQLGYAGDEIKYLTGFATDVDLLHHHGLTEKTVDIAITIYPVVMPPSNVLRMNDPGLQSLQRQYADFQQIFKSILPNMLRDLGCFLGKVFSCEELPLLRQMIADNLTCTRALISARMYAAADYRLIANLGNNAVSDTAFTVPLLSVAREQQRLEATNNNAKLKEHDRTEEMGGTVKKTY